MAIAAYLRISVDEEIGKDNTSIETRRALFRHMPPRNFPMMISNILRTVTAQATPLSSVRVISICAEV